MSLINLNGIVQQGTVWYWLILKHTLLLCYHLKMKSFIFSLWSRHNVLGSQLNMTLISQLPAKLIHWLQVSKCPAGTLRTPVTCTTLLYNSGSPPTCDSICLIVIQTQCDKLAHDYHQESTIEESVLLPYVHKIWAHQVMKPSCCSVKGAVKWSNKQLLVQANSRDFRLLFYLQPSNCPLHPRTRYQGRQ